MYLYINGSLFTGCATKPGDVVITRSGKTVQVGNIAPLYSTILVQYCTVQYLYSTVKFLYKCIFFKFNMFVGSSFMKRH